MTDRERDDERKQEVRLVTPAFGSVLLLFMFSLVIVFTYRQQVATLKHDIYVQCESEVVYEASAQETRRAVRDYYQQYTVDESDNKFIDNTLRMKRIAGAQELIFALDDTLSKTPSVGCSRYKR